jgi:hypothetical protein
MDKNRLQEKRRKREAKRKIAQAKSRAKWRQADAEKRRPKPIKFVSAPPTPGVAITPVQYDKEAAPVESLTSKIGSFFGVGK